MSCTEIYKVNADYIAEHFGEAKNACGYAMLVWDALSDKYGTRSSKLFDYNATWGLFNSGRLTAEENIVLGSTFDRVWVARENIKQLADAQRSFYEAFGGGKAGTLMQCAEMLETLLGDPDAIGCAFNMTSVNGDVFWQTYNEDADDYDGHDIRNPHPDYDGEAWELFDSIRKATP